MKRDRIVLKSENGKARNHDSGKWEWSGSFENNRNYAEYFTGIYAIEMEL